MITILITLYALIGLIAATITVYNMKFFKLDFADYVTIGLTYFSVGFLWPIFAIFITFGYLVSKLMKGIAFIHVKIIESRLRSKVK